MENLPQVQNSSMGLSGVNETFSCLEAEDVIMQKIKISQPTSQTTVEAGKFYDVSDGSDLGTEINVFIFSKKKTSYMGEDFSTKVPKLIESHEVLLMPETLDFPIIINLSLSGYFSFKNLLTKLLKSYGKKNLPIYTPLVKITTELVINDKGKYYIPKFEFVRNANEGELKLLAIAYGQIVPLFRQMAMDEDIKQPMNVSVSVEVDETIPDEGYDNMECSTSEVSEVKQPVKLTRSDEEIMDGLGFTAKEKKDITAGNTNSTMPLSTEDKSKVIEELGF